MKKTLLCFLFFSINAYSQDKENLKKKSLVPDEILATCPQTLSGCNFNNWPNPLKGSTITYTAPVNGNCYDGSVGTQWNCISTRANQTWFYIRILTSGNIRFVFNNSSNVDVDGVLWGPLANGDISQACSATQSTPIFCDYNVSPTVELPCTTHSSLCGGTTSGTLSVQAGQVYLICILNYANQPTNITLTQPIGGSVFYSQESQDIQIEHFRVNNGNLNQRTSLKNAGIEDSGIFKVCADGAVSSLFKITTSAQNLKARIGEDPNTSNIPLYGSFSNISFSNGVYEISYKHPDYISSIATYSQFRIEIYSNDNPSIVLASFPIRIHPAPFLMIHGLWSNGSPLEGSCFEILENDLSTLSAYKINTNITSTKLYLQANYEPWNDANFASNNWVVPNHINYLQNYLTSEGYAVSKFDLLGHSMGGILARQYLQSSQYQNNIHKLITLNTPHSGSQMANFLSNPLNTGDGLCEYIREFMSGNPATASCQSGAIEDLRVDSPAISTLNNGTGLSKVVPSHTIATTFPSSTVLTGLARLPKVGMLAYLLNLAITTIFNNEANDGVVALSSQRGGVPTNAQSYPSSTTPHSSQGNSTVVNQIKSLLERPTTSNSFTISGFNPPVLSYSNIVSPKLEPITSLNNATISIIQPLNNIRANRGTTLNFQITATNVSEINVIIDYDEDEVVTYKTLTSPANFSVSVDNGFTIGKHSILALGKLANGNTVTQKIYFEVVNCVAQYNPLGGNLSQSYYQAQNIIVTNGQIPFGQNVNMTAGKSITLTPGFVTDPYINFSAKINNCGN